MGNCWMLLSQGEVKLDFCSGRIIEDFVEDELVMERLWSETD